MNKKQKHLKIAFTKDIQFKDKTTGFENYEFIHQALPELNFDEINLKTEFLGKILEAPFLISSLTGGIPLASKINKNLAIAAEDLKIAMAVGSQRVAIENPKITFGFQLREFAPSTVLLANLGAVQLNYGFGIEECKKAIEEIGADGLIFHLNPLQEVFQNEDVNFKGILKKIKTVSSSLEVPIIVKEIGFGISYDVGKKLEDFVYAIDVAGAGGTCWALVEGWDNFANWGIPTADAIFALKDINCKIIASGGIRTGIDVAKAIALGADLVGIGFPLLKLAKKSSFEVKNYFQKLIKELKIVMFSIGAKNLDELRNTRFLIKVKNGKI